MATITQLRTLGHCGLNYYLYRFGKRHCPYYWEYGKGKETLEHYLLEYRRYYDERIKLRKELKHNVEDMGRTAEMNQEGDKEMRK